RSRSVPLSFSEHPLPLSFRDHLCTFRAQVLVRFVYDSALVWTRKDEVFGNHDVELIARSDLQRRAGAHSLLNRLLPDGNELRTCGRARHLRRHRPLVWLVVTERSTHSAAERRHLSHRLPSADQTHERCGAEGTHVVVVHLVG